MRTLGKRKTVGSDSHYWLLQKESEMTKLQSVYNEKEFARLKAEADEDMPFVEPYSITEVEITDDGDIFVVFMGPSGYMVTEGELELRRMLPEDKQKEVALHWRATRARANRDGMYPHQWVE